MLLIFKGVPLCTESNPQDITRWLESYARDEIVQHFSFENSLLQINENLVSRLAKNFARWACFQPVSRKNEHVFILELCSPKQSLQDAVNNLCCFFESSSCNRNKTPAI